MCSSCTVQFWMMCIYSTVVLSGSTQNPSFRGFLIQGRTAADGSPAGTFVIGASAANQQAVCTGNVRTII